MIDGGITAINEKVRQESVFVQSLVSLRRDGDNHNSI
jgi:hypothetical protein